MGPTTKAQPPDDPLEGSRKAGPLTNAWEVCQTERAIAEAAAVEAANQGIDEALAMTGPTLKPKGQVSSRKSSDAAVAWYIKSLGSVALLDKEREVILGRQVAALMKWEQIRREVGASVPGLVPRSSLPDECVLTPNRRIYPFVPSWSSSWAAPPPLMNGRRRAAFEAVLT